MKSVVCHHTDVKSIDVKYIDNCYYKNLIILSFRLKENTNCIIFVKRIIVARTLTYILRNLKALDFWNCEFLVGFHSGVRGMSRSKVNAIVEKFRAGEVCFLSLLVVLIFLYNILLCTISFQFPISI